MKKHVSVFGFYIRSSIYKVLLAVLLMVLAETGVFLLKFRGELANYYELSEVFVQENAGVAYLARPEKVLDNSFTSLLFAVAIIIVSVILCLPGCEFGAKTSYIIKRLQVSERACFFWQMLCSLMLYLLVYAVQLATVFGLSQ